VFASRIAFETSLGNPSYSYKYRLGGFDYLRAYETNRFIGDQLLLIQGEERINLYKEYIAGTISLEAGSVTKSLIDNFRISKVIGLRIAMPPDWTNMLCINLGIASDQNNISMEFNENF
jgi:hemolysin activation/secretion protein